jgi:signal transduction histidine kinase
MELAEKSYSRRNSVVTGAFTVEGKEFFVEMNAKRYIEQYFITIRDITAMTNVLANAERTGRLNKEKNIMLVKLSNEIKSPIQSIIGFSQALIDGLGGEINDKQGKYVKIINKNSTELLYFMDKFLEFAQAESSLFNYDNQPFDLVNLIQTVVKNNENILNAKNILINYDFEDFNKKVVYSDENNVKTILQNILETSIKLTDVGTITIKVDYPEMELIEKQGIKIFKGGTSSSYARIVISDTGMGLAETEMDGIFEPYTQLDKAHKKTVVRSITLGTVKAILKRLGGAIWVNSEVMKGSSFTVILPIEKE